jgi:hypothetical protein
MKAAELELDDEDMAEKKAMQALMEQVNAMQQGMSQLVQMQDGKRAVGVEKIKGPDGKMVAARVRRADGSVEEVTIQ